MHLLQKLVAILFAGLLSTTLIVGCSSGGDATRTTDQQDNSFPDTGTDPIAPDEDTDSGSQETPDINEIIVSVEATEAMVASWQRDLYNLMTPQKAYAFNGLERVSVRDIDVVQVDSNLTARSNPTVFIESTFNRNSNGTYGVQFTANIPNQIDVLVRVLLDNGEVLWAPVYSGSSLIKVNIISTFVVEALFEGMARRRIALASIVPCGADLGCLNQHEARFVLWQSLVEGAQGFDIEIPSELDLEQTRDFLEDQTDFNKFLDDGIDSILKRGYVEAISKDLDLENILNSQSTDFNTVYYAMSLGQFQPDNQANGAVLSTRASVSATQLLDDGSTEFTYPVVNETELATTVTIRSLFGDTPYKRKSLTQPDPETDAFNVPLGTETNSLSSNPANGFINLDGTINYQRTPFQTITARNSANPTGWLTNPYYSVLYGNLTRDYLLSADLSTSKAYQLARKSDSQFSREFVMESLANFHFVTNLKASSDGGFDIETASNDSEYGVVMLRQRFDEAQDIEVVAETALWNVSDGTITQTQPATGITQQFTSWQLIRNDDNSASGLTPLAPSTSVKTIDDEDTVYYDAEAGSQLSINAGRISLNQDGRTVAQGASNTDAQMMAFSIRNDALGHGIINAVRLDGGSFDLSDTRYTLQGHVIYMDDDKNDITSFNGSEISIDGNNQVQLSLSRVGVSQNVSTMSVSELNPRQDLVITTGLLQSSNQIQLRFDDVNGNPMTMQGFLSEDGNILVFLVRHGDGLGIIYGFRDLELPVS